MKNQDHWEQIYASKEPFELSWFKTHLKKSLELIDKTQLEKDSQIIDVGGGASTLVDDLMERGFDKLTVLDLSATALNRMKKRMGGKAGSVTWIVGDVTQLALPENKFDLWHDRAVFHFLTEREDRRLYLENLRRTLKPDGHFIIATFADDGPEKCSGMQVERYDAEKLRKIIGEDFEFLESFTEHHETPFGTTQNFIYAHFRLSR